MKATDQACQLRAVVTNRLLWVFFKKKKDKTLTAARPVTLYSYWKQRH